MKHKIDYDYRPQSYWEHDNPLSEILAGISGKARRAMIREFYERDLMEELHPDLLADALDPVSRKRLGAINPYFMGGEYLPERLPGEVAIVRIELESTTHDVIELRTRLLDDGKISLCWVDEYESGFDTPFDEIQCPFSFAELIAFMQATKLGAYSLPMGYNILNCNDCCDAASLRDFTTLQSEYYQQLQKWFEDEVESWINDTLELDQPNNQRYY